MRDFGKVVKQLQGWVYLGWCTIAHPSCDRARVVVAVAEARDRGVASSRVREWRGMLVGVEVLPLVKGMPGVTASIAALMPDFHTGG